jgi:DNA-binding MarR family transcriptional regulator
MSLKPSDLFTVQITSVSHGYVIRTTKGEAFAYETKEALLNAFKDMFGIQSPFSSAVLPYEESRVKIIEYLKQAGDRKVTISDIAKDLKLDTVTTALILRDLRAKGPVEVPGSSAKKEQHFLKPEVKDKEMDTFKEPDPFSLKNHLKHNIGSSLWYREGDTIAVKRKGCPDVVYIKDADVGSLRAKNRGEFYQYTGAIGKVKQDILWGYLEDLRDDSLGCFRKLKTDTRADGKLDSLLEDDV